MIEGRARGGSEGSKHEKMKVKGDKGVQLCKLAAGQYCYLAKPLT